jgi:outer membrane protein
MNSIAETVEIHSRSTNTRQREVIRMRGKRGSQQALKRHLVRAAALMVTVFSAAAAGAQQAPQPVQLTLKQAVAMALRNSRDLSLARLQFQASQRETAFGRSQFRPNLYGGSGAAYTSGFPLLASGGAPALFTLSYDQAIFNRTAQSDVRVAEQHARQQQLQVDSVRNAVIVRVASAYLELAKARRELDLLQRERASAQKILDYTRQRAAAGFELPIEVTKAQLTSARIEQRIAHLEDREDTLGEELRDQLGLPSGQPIAVVSEDIPPSASENVNQLVAEALENNVELKQAESEQVASAEHLRGERGGYWPTVSLIGQYNLLGKFNHYDQFFNKFTRNNWIAGVEVQIPIFASRTSSAVALAQANLEAAQAAVQTKRTELSLDVRHKAHLAREAETGREVARLELELAQQNLQVVQAQFQQGRASLRDLEAAQLDENDKWLAFLDADFARQQAQLDLLQSTGQVATLFQ